MDDGRARRARSLLNNLMVIWLVAVVWLLAVFLNNYVFFVWTQKEAYIHWIFVPAGVRIVLIMLFGWRAAVGMALGAIPAIDDILPGIGLAMVAVVSSGAALMPWLCVALFSAVVGPRHPWTDLDWWHLPVLAVLCAFVSELFLNVQLIFLGFEERADFASNLLTGMIGNFLGALVLLVATVACIRLLRAARAG